MSIFSAELMIPSATMLARQGDLKHGWLLTMPVLSATHPNMRLASASRKVGSLYCPRDALMAVEERLDIMPVR